MNCPHHNLPLKISKAEGAIIIWACPVEDCGYKMSEDLGNLPPREDEDIEAWRTTVD